MENTSKKDGMDQRKRKFSSICPFCLKDFQKSDWYSIEISPAAHIATPDLKEEEVMKEGTDWYMSYLIDQVNKEYNSLKMHFCSAKCMRDYCSENPSICRPI